MNGPGATNDCAAASDRLPELALGILSGNERAEVLAHLDTWLDEDPVRSILPLRDLGPPVRSAPT